MERRYRVKRGDVPPMLTGTCADAEGPVDLSLASEVRLLLRRRGAAEPKVSAAVAVTDGPLGRWLYAWGPDDLDTAGVFDLEIQATWPDGKRLTFPSHGYNEVIVEGDLG